MSLKISAILLILCVTGAFGADIRVKRGVFDFILNLKDMFSKKLTEKALNFITTYCFPKTGEAGFIDFALCFIAELLELTGLEKCGIDVFDIILLIGCEGCKDPVTEFILLVNKKCFGTNTQQENVQKICNLISAIQQLVKQSSKPWSFIKEPLSCYDFSEWL